MVEKNLWDAACEKLAPAWAAWKQIRDQADVAWNESEVARQEGDQDAQDEASRLHGVYMGLSNSVHRLVEAATLREKKKMLEAGKVAGVLTKDQDAELATWDERYT